MVHADEDHPHDRTHRDDGVSVPAILRERAFEDGILTERAVEGHIVLGRWQRDGEDQVWRFIGTDEGVELELSEESFHRLVIAMAELNARQAPPPEPGRRQ